MKLFLDMDGVLTDFTTGLMEALHIPYAYHAYPFEMNVWDFFPEIFARHGKTFDDCNDVCTHEFWAKLPWMHDGQKILNTVLSKFNNDDVYLLTAPMPNLGSPSGKWEWIERNIPEFKKRTIITNVDKGLLAGPGRVLIDDKNENIDAFWAAGGHGILCPRPWNKRYPWVKDKIFTAPVIVNVALEMICG